MAGAPLSESNEPAAPGVPAQAPQVPPEPAARPNRRRLTPLSIGTSRYVPRPVQKLAWRRFNRDSLKRRRAARVGPDKRDNAQTRLPEGEHVWTPTLWIVELYTPSSISELFNGLTNLQRKQTGMRGDEDPAAWVREKRRTGNTGWRQLPVVRPAAPQPDFGFGTVVDRVPPGFSEVGMQLVALTTAVTAVVAEFRIDPRSRQSIEDILNRDFATSITRIRGGQEMRDVRNRKAEAVAAWRKEMRGAAVEWLAALLPGYFARNASGQPPTLELLLTAQHRPWDSPTDLSERQFWRECLEITPWRGYWQGSSIPALRLAEQQEHRQGDAPRHVLLFGALRDEFVNTFRADGFAADDLDLAIDECSRQLARLATRWALTALLREVDERLTAQPDLAVQVGTTRSPWKLNKIQKSVTQTALDGRVVATSIVDYARDANWWKHEVLDFDMAHPTVTPAAVSAPVPAAGGRNWAKISPRLRRQRPAAAPAEPEAGPTSLPELLRTAQIEDGRRIIDKEAELREILSISTDLRVTSLNLSLQWLAVFVAVVALTVGAIAAWAAVKAIPQPAPAPSASIATAVATDAGHHVP